MSISVNILLNNDVIIVISQQNNYEALRSFVNSNIFIDNYTFFTGIYVQSLILLCFISIICCLQIISSH